MVAVVATLRSRGGYGSDEILDFDVTGVTDTVMGNTAAIATDPFANFNYYWNYGSRR